MISFFLMILRLLRTFFSGFKDEEFQGLFFIALIILISGTVFYRQIEGWRWLDSAYFSLMTLTTVGYGDFCPKTDLGKIFTMIYTITGIGLFLSFINLVAKHMRQNRRPRKL